MIRDILDEVESPEEAGVYHEIPISNVSSQILHVVIQYIEYRHTNPTDPIEQPLWVSYDYFFHLLLLCLYLQGDIVDSIDEWDRMFLVDIDRRSLGWIECLQAANFLNIQKLLELIGAALAFRIEMVPLSELRVLYGNMDLPCDVLQSYVCSYISCNPVHPVPVVLTI